jgi:NTP pyrophosphatase (non-canonical NTP hydrolase)
MQPEEYIVRQQSFNPRLRESLWTITSKTFQHRLNFAKSAMGMLGEAVELRTLLDSTFFDRAKVVKELGDVCWYTSLGFALNDKPIRLFNDAEVKLFVPTGYDGPLEALDAVVDRLIAHAGAYSEYMKKWLFHEHPFDAEVVDNLLRTVIGDVQTACAIIGVGIEDVFERNIEKLTARYPNGFEAGASLNKDETRE